VSNRVVENEQRLWVSALIPSSIVALIALVLCAALRHKSGLLGALLASATVIIFFSVHLLISKISTNLDPMITMALAMFSYFAKVIVMGVFLLLITRLTSPTTVDRTSFGVSAIAIAVAWLGGEIRAFFKLRIHLPLPEKK